MFTKKAEVNTAFKIILAVLVVIVLVILFKNQLQAGVKVIKCNENNGECKDKISGVTSCAADQFAYPAIDCQASQDCCLSNSQKLTTTVSDAECNSKKDGDACGASSGEHYRCLDKYCISGCDFCARRPTDASCKVSVNGINIAWGPQFICGCNLVDCQKSSTAKDGKCLLNAVPAGSYFCSTNVYCCQR